MKILILAVGKPKNKFLAAMANDYLTRIRPAGFVSVESVPDAAQNASERALASEAERLLKKLKPSDCVILLHDTGIEYSSVGFADFISRELNIASGRLVFIIGGPWGIGEDVKNRADIKLSLSKMTFTHEMCFLFLCEQLYRAYSIIHDTGYHH